MLLPCIVRSNISSTHGSLFGEGCVTMREGFLGSEVPSIKKVVCWSTTHGASQIERRPLRYSFGSYIFCMPIVSATSGYRPQNLNFPKARVNSVNIQNLEFPDRRNWSRNLASVITR